MRIVIGGSGDVGFHLAEALADAGHSLTLIDSDGIFCNMLQIKLMPLH